MPSPAPRRADRQWGVYCSDGELWQDGFTEDQAKYEVEVADVQCNFDGCSGHHEPHPVDPDAVG